RTPRPTAPSRARARRDRPAPPRTAEPRRRTGSAAAPGSPAAAATSTRGSAGAQAEPPNLLVGPAFRPRGRNRVVVLMVAGVLGRMEPAKVEQPEPVFAQAPAHPGDL